MSKTESNEEMFWEMTRQETDFVGEIPSDEELSDYRAGELTETRMSEIETILASSPQARARLAELAGVDLSSAPSRVRENLFGELGSATQSGGWWRVAAAALLAIALGLVGFTLLDRSREAGPPESVVAVLSTEFEINVEGLATTRGEKGISEAYPGTRVRILVEDSSGGSGAFEVGIYRSTGNRLDRVIRGLNEERYQGAGVVVGTARDIVGTDEAGTHSFYIVVGAPEGLPETIPSSETEMWKVYARQLTLRAGGDPRNL